MSTAKWTNPDGYGWSYRMELTNMAAHGGYSSGAITVSESTVVGVGESATSEIFRHTYTHDTMSARDIVSRWMRQRGVEAEAAMRAAAALVLDHQ